MRREFRLPDVGEGLTEADIVSWRVQPGDTVTVNQIIVDIETAKAVVELPSPYAGVVAALLVPEGETVDVGTPIIAVDVPGARARGGPWPHRSLAVPRRPRRALAPKTGRAPPPRPARAAASGRPSWSATASRPARPPGARARGPPLRPRPRQPGGTGGKRFRCGCPDASPRQRRAGRPPERAGEAAGPQAGPGAGGGPGRAGRHGAGRVHQPRRRAAGRGRAGRPGAGSAVAGGGSPGPREERIPIRGVRKHTAAAVAESAAAPRM